MHFQKFRITNVDYSGKMKRKLNKNKKSKNNFENQPVGTLLWKLALPSILSQMVNMAYSIIDRMFLGRMENVGSMALAGLGITLPLITIITAFSYLIGSGGAPFAAIAMGKQNQKEAERILGNCWILLIIISVILTVAFLIWGEPMLLLMGADNETLPYAKSYLNIYVLGTIFVMLSLGLTPFLITQGFNKVSMRNTLIGAGVNIILDPIFIYGFHMGIMGAAIATIISQGVTAYLIISFLLGNQTRLRIRLERLDTKLIVRILGLGSSAFFMYVTNSLVQSVLYKQILLYGNSKYVAALSIMITLDQFVFLPASGVGQGAQPIISYSFGAGDLLRLKQAIKLLVIVSDLLAIVGVIIVELFPKILFQIFTNDSEVIKIGVYGVRIFVIGRSVNGIQLALQEMFRAIGYSKTAMFNATIRKIVLIIPLAIILPTIGDLGYKGIYWAECLSDVIAAISAVTVYFILKKGIYRRVEENAGRRKPMS